MFGRYHCPRGLKRRLTIDDWLKAADWTWRTVSLCLSNRNDLGHRDDRESGVWHVVKQYAGQIGILKLTPHDVRSCACLCLDSGGELEQYSFSLATSPYRPRNTWVASSDSARP